MHEVSNHHKIPSAAAAVHNVSYNKLRDSDRQQQLHRAVAASPHLGRRSTVSFGEK